MEPRIACLLFAYACSQAVAYDASIPRPGLSSTVRPRRNPDPASLLAASPRAYRLCLSSCTLAARRKPQRWAALWARTVEELAGRGWGNPAMGSLLLLSLQAASLGSCLERRGSDSLDCVMGMSRLLVEEAGVEGAKAFYRALAAASPSYLGRLSWAGLPDASSPSLALDGIVAARITLLDVLEKASLYDPVSRDASRYLELSMGIALPELVEHRDCIGEGVARATLLIVGLEGDFVAFRKQLWGGFRSLALEAYQGSTVALAMLWGLFRRGSAGPGSAADIVGNALARLVYEAEKQRKPLSFTSCRPLSGPSTLRAQPCR